MHVACLSISWYGSITSDILKAYNIKVCGVGKLEMALMYFLHCLTVSVVISKSMSLSYLEQV